uniref:Uncharacterized protein n=1 Tax=Arundo donax TaxID=35708 RepID=A0A0A9CGC7_ARUDO
MKVYCLMTLSGLQVQVVFGDLQISHLCIECSSLKIGKYSYFLK